MASKLVIFIVFLAFSFAHGCDETEWQNLSNQYDACVSHTKSPLDEVKTEDPDSPDICSLMDKLIGCSETLTQCMDTHLEVAEAKLFSLPIDVELWEATAKRCSVQQRFRRSPGKGGGRGGGGRSGGRSGSGSVRSRVSSTISRGRSAVSSLLNRRKSTSSSSSSVGGTKKKKGLFKKVGKYAVAGLAAYGTYKLAKKMSKGLRLEYDDDDCWEYSFLQDQYECVCPGQCNVYVGSAASVGLTFSLLLMSSFFTTIYTRVII